VSGYRGLGIVKLMGRSSGFIAMQASMASGALGAPLMVWAVLCNGLGMLVQEGVFCVVA
jgi:hypothetical protein